MTNEQVIIVWRSLLSLEPRDLSVLCDCFSPLCDGARVQTSEVVTSTSLSYDLCWSGQSLRTAPSPLSLAPYTVVRSGVIHSSADASVGEHRTAPDLLTRPHIRSVYFSCSFLYFLLIDVLPQSCLRHHQTAELWILTALYCRDINKKLYKDYRGIVRQWDKYFRDILVHQHRTTSVRLVLNTNMSWYSNSNTSIAV